TANVQLVLEGHTDNSGPVDLNMALSKQRAETVRNYLVAKGVDPSRLSVQEFGAKNPIADNSTEQGRNKNRRVVIRAVGENNQ
ncbi:MAG TPA: OmpA family protein, partial [Flavisolibacter sp.]|nr:OmpA family protein [Flavisolibacter sp.]